MKDEKMWYMDDVEEENDYSFKEYEVTSTPNDFNTKTIIDFIESGLFKIPFFQRNYVWDISKASKLVESIIIGLPIPQVFLYEEDKNSYLVIDGQQRLLSLYFFQKQKFPKKGKRTEIRQIFKEYGKFSEEYLHDANYFEDFKLKLNTKYQLNKNKLDGLSYHTLGEYKNSFDLRTIRNVMIKQNFPEDDDSAMFEIFNRLNSGGAILKAQEIRASLYHSKFYSHLYEMNSNSTWRNLLNRQEFDIHMKDIEILLRGFAMLLKNGDYKPSMTNFLNRFSKYSSNLTDESLEYFCKLFTSFCDDIYKINPKTFIAKNGVFSITIFESIFVALCEDCCMNKKVEAKKTTIEKIDKLKNNPDFVHVTQSDTASSKNVKKRLELARNLL